jgi:hypothetical protein
MSREAGKGVKYIPKNISDDEYDKRWEMTFGKKKDLTKDEISDKVRGNYDVDLVLSKIR